MDILLGTVVVIAAMAAFVEGSRIVAESLVFIGTLVIKVLSRIFLGPELTESEEPTPPSRRTPAPRQNQTAGLDPITRRYRAPASPARPRQNQTGGLDPITGIVAAELILGGCDTPNHEDAASVDNADGRRQIPETAAAARGDETPETAAATRGEEIPETAPATDGRPPRRELDLDHR